METYGDDEILEQVMDPGQEVRDFFRQECATRDRRMMSLAQIKAAMLTENGIQERNLVREWPKKR